MASVLAKPWTTAGPMKATTFEASSIARDLLGEQFVDHYVRTREWEVRQYERAVTDWELERYFEII